jgi:hypothetical protein
MTIERAMTIEQRAYFAAGDEVHYLCGWAYRGRVHLEASRSLELTPAEVRQLARSLLFAAARAQQLADA